MIIFPSFSSVVSFLSLIIQLLTSIVTSSSVSPQLTNFSSFALWGFLPSGKFSSTFPFFFFLFCAFLFLVPNSYAAASFPNSLLKGVISQAFTGSSATDDFSGMSSFYLICQSSLLMVSLGNLQWLFSDLLLGTFPALKSILIVSILPFHEKIEPP